MPRLGPARPNVVFRGDPGDLACVTALVGPTQSQSDLLRALDWEALDARNYLALSPESAVATGGPVGGAGSRR
jgi:hypothetical protein